MRTRSPGVVGHERHGRRIAFQLPFRILTLVQCHTSFRLARAHLADQDS